MREYIPTEVANALYKRAVGKCECRNPECGHPPGECCGKMDLNAGVAIPEGTAEKDRVRLGECVCQMCHQQAGSFARQRL